MNQTCRRGSAAALSFTCILIAVLSAADSRGAPLSATPPASRPQTCFIENRGQYDEQVKYVLRGAYGAVFFTATEVVFSFVRENAPATRTGNGKNGGAVDEDEHPNFSRLDFRFRFGERTKT